MNYISVELVKAQPMTYGEYEKEMCGCGYEETEFTKIDSNEDGYMVSGGHIQWLHKKEFEESYKTVTGMTFGLAVAAMKKGYNVTRKGWNGKEMYLQAQIPDANSKMTHPYLYMTVPGCEEGIRRLPWQPAQVDIFAEDWSIAD